jgi:dihydrodipicolinate synthase/N-acetylneuraminate lyase
MAHVDFQPSRRRGLAEHRDARRIWSTLETFVPLLFREANPMPVKYCLWRQGLLRSPECRFPLTRVSSKLACELDQAMANGGLVSR